MASVNLLVFWWKGVNMDDIKVLEDKIANILDEITDYDSDKIIIAYNHLGYPSASYSEDVLYFYIDIDDAEISRIIQREYNYGLENQSKTEKLSIHFYAYGDKSIYNLRKLALDWYSAKTKLELNSIGLYTIPFNNNGPHRLMENYDGFWWTRSDMVLEVYYSYSTSNAIGYYDKYNIVIKEDK